MSKPGRQRIGIAVVIRQSSVLVGERPASAPLPGMAEFPGGKCESGELPRACAVRECQEETGIVVEPQSQLTTIDWDYDHGSVELHFWLCRPGADLPEDVPLQAPFRWVPISELQTLRFPEANAAVIELLQQQIADPEADADPDADGAVL